MRYMRWSWGDLMSAPASVVSYIVELLEEQQRNRKGPAHKG